MVQGPGKRTGQGWPGWPAQGRPKIWGGNHPRFGIQGNRPLALGPWGQDLEKERRFLGPVVSQGDWPGNTNGAPVSSPDSQGGGALANWFWSPWAPRGASKKRKKPIGALGGANNKVPRAFPGVKNWGQGETPVGGFPPGRGQFPLGGSNWATPRGGNSPWGGSYKGLIPNYSTLGGEKKKTGGGGIKNPQSPGAQTVWGAPRKGPV